MKTKGDRGLGGLEVAGLTQVMRYLLPCPT